MLVCLMSKAALADSAAVDSSKTTTNPNEGMFYAEAIDMTLDKKLPEVFKFVAHALVAVDYPNKRVMLSFLFPPQSKDDQGSMVRVGWAYQDDNVDQKCGVRTIKAVAPKGSTPYYESFVITVKDYTNNTCAEFKDAPKTEIVFDTFEVAYNEKTKSVITASPLVPIPSDALNPWVPRKKEQGQASPGTGAQAI